MRKGKGKLTYCQLQKAYERLTKENKKLKNELHSRTAAFNKLLSDIDIIPAADVAPVRRGRWLQFHSTAAGDIQYCSACEIGCTWKPNYCPNCGAKMDI